MSVQLKLDAFEGPLDLLLHLIERAEIDIYEISIAEITEQYMAVLQEMQKFELEIASEFLVMASTLLAMKSRRLLPKPEPDIFQPAFDMDMEEADPREQLILRLIEYKRFKMLAETLKERERERAKIFSRLPSDLEAFMPEKGPNPVKNVSLYDLIEAFQSVLKKSEQSEPVSRVRRDEMSVNERTEWLRTILQRKKNVSFLQLFSSQPSRQAIVVTFLALLELIKKREVLCEQRQLFTDIVIRRRETSEVQRASGLQ